MSEITYWVDTSDDFVNHRCTAYQVLLPLLHRLWLITYGHLVEMKQLFIIVIVACLVLEVDPEHANVYHEGYKSKDTVLVVSQIDARFCEEETEYEVAWHSE